MLCDSIAEQCQRAKYLRLAARTALRTSGRLEGIDSLQPEERRQFAIEIARRSINNRSCFNSIQPKDVLLYRAAGNRILSNVPDPAFVAPGASK